MTFTADELNRAILDVFDPDENEDQEYYDLDEWVTETAKLETSLGTVVCVSYEVVGGYEQSAYAVVKHVESGRTFIYEGYYSSYGGAQFEEYGKGLVEVEVIEVTANKYKSLLKDRVYPLVVES